MFEALSPAVFPCLLKLPPVGPPPGCSTWPAAGWWELWGGVDPVGPAETLPWPPAMLPTIIRVKRYVEARPGVWFRLIERRRSTNRQGYEVGGLYDVVAEPGKRAEFIMVLPPFRRGGSP